MVQLTVPRLVAGVAVIAGVALVSLILLSGTDESLNSATSPGGTFNRAVAAELAGDLTSGDAERVRQALAVPRDANLSAEGLSALANLWPVAFDLDSFEDLGNGTSRVRFTSGGGARWDAWLRFEDGRWRITATRSLT